jgi:hypothetical protein
MHNASEIVKQEVVENRNSGFHKAIRRFWDSYPSTSLPAWTARRGAQGHVLECNSDQSNAEPTLLTFNLLEGRLLGGGHKISRLPRDYEADEAYLQLFGKQVLQVGPSTLEGMCFSTSRSHQGWVVHFGMFEKAVIIKAVRHEDMTPNCRVPDSKVYEFVPRSRLERDLPASFISNYSHWLLFDSKTVEFRLASKPWESSPKNWTLIQESGHYILRKDGDLLIEPQSKTGKALSAAVRSLEVTANLNMIFRPADSTVVMRLPRFCLSFTIGAGQPRIISKDYAGMCIDPSQRIGTLIGLKHKLVLRQEDAVAEHCGPRRIVLVPRGQLSVKEIENHVEVAIRKPKSPYIHINHDAFSVDSTLGRLVSSGATSSTLLVPPPCIDSPLPSRFADWKDGHRGSAENPEICVCSVFSTLGCGIQHLAA